VGRFDGTLQALVGLEVEVEQERIRLLEPSASIRPKKQVSTYDALVNHRAWLGVAVLIDICDGRAIETCVMALKRMSKLPRPSMNPHALCRK
jgi:hypothetical protein